MQVAWRRYSNFSPRELTVSAAHTRASSRAISLTIFFCSPPPSAPSPLRLPPQLAPFIESCRSELEIVVLVEDRVVVLLLLALLVELVVVELLLLLAALLLLLQRRRLLLLARGRGRGKRGGGVGVGVGVGVG